MNLTASVYACQVLPSRLYSLTALSSLNVAETRTSPFVAIVTSADATGASGSVLSMLPTMNSVMAETFPASSVPRKLTEPFSVNLTASVYACQVMPSRLYSLTALSSLNTAVTVTS